MKYLKLILLFSLGNELLAQKISNVKAVSEGNQVKIIYDFEAPDANQKYRVELFSSLDNFVNPLNSVSGAVGDTIVAGRGKTVYWSSNRAGLNYEGLVSFEVRARKFTPLKFTNIFAQNYMMGKNIDVSYIGYKHNPQSYFILTNAKDSVRVPTQPSATNASQVQIPKMNAGSYNLKLVNPDDNQVAVSTEFVIKKNRHLLLKIGVPVAVIAAGAGVYFLTNKTTTTTTESDLPDPIKPLN